MLTDRQALVATLYGEASNQGIAGQIGVACAIRNRVEMDLHNERPDWWGEGFRGVCLAPAQFSCWWGQNGNVDRVYALAQALVDRQPVGPEIAELAWIAEGILGGAIRDKTHGATHYLTTALYRSPARPQWASKATFSCELGDHTFFRNVP